MSRWETLLLDAFDSRLVERRASAGRAQQLKNMRLLSRDAAHVEVTAAALQGTGYRNTVPRPAPHLR